MRMSRLILLLIISNVLSVASTASGDYKSGFSTHHLSVDISSPGSGILSAYPRQ